MCISAALASPVTFSGHYLFAWVLQFEVTWATGASSFLFLACIAISCFLLSSSSRGSLDRESLLLFLLVFVSADGICFSFSTASALGIIVVGESGAVVVLSTLAFFNCWARRSHDCHSDFFFQVKSRSSSWSAVPSLPSQTQFIDIGE